MARSLQIQYPEALYHITSRGDGQERIYISDEHRLSHEIHNSSPDPRCMTPDAVNQVSKEFNMSKDILLTSIKDANSSRGQGLNCELVLKQSILD